MSVVEDATVTLFTVRPVAIVGPPPEYESEAGAVIRVRKGDETQERVVSLSPEVLEEIEGLAAYLFSTGLSVTMAEGDIDQVEGNVCDRHYTAYELDLHVEVVDLDESQLTWQVLTLTDDPDIVGVDFIDALVVLTGEEMKEIAVQMIKDFDIDVNWL